MVLFKRKDNKNGEETFRGKPRGGLRCPPCSCPCTYEYEKPAVLPRWGWARGGLERTGACLLHCSIPAPVPNPMWSANRDAWREGQKLQMPDWSTHPNKESELVGVKTFSLRQNTFWKLFVKTIKHLQWSKISLIDFKNKDDLFLIPICFIFPEMEVLVIYKMFVVSQQKKSLEEQAQSVTFPGA